MPTPGSHCSDSNARVARVVLGPEGISTPLAFKPRFKTVRQNNTNASVKVTTRNVVRDRKKTADGYKARRGLPPLPTSRGKHHVVITIDCTPSGFILTRVKSALVGQHEFPALLRSVWSGCPPFSRLCRAFAVLLPSGVSVRIAHRDFHLALAVLFDRCCSLNNQIINLGEQEQGGRG